MFALEDIAKHQLFVDKSLCRNPHTVACVDLNKHCFAKVLFCNVIRQFLLSTGFTVWKISC